MMRPRRTAISSHTVGRYALSGHRNGVATPVQLAAGSQRHGANLSVHPFHPRLDDWGGENERTGVTSGLIPSTPARERIGKKSGRGLRSRVSHSPNVQGDERERDAQSGRPPSPPTMREWKRRRPPLGWPFFMSLLLRPAVRVRASHMLLARTAAGSSREVAGATVPTHRENREKSGRLPQADHRTGGRQPHSSSPSYSRYREPPQGSSRPPQPGRE